MHEVGKLSVPQKDCKQRFADAVLVVAVVELFSTVEPIQNILIVLRAKLYTKLTLLVQASSWDSDQK